MRSNSQKVAKTQLCEIILPRGKKKLLASCHRADTVLLHWVPNY